MCTACASEHHTRWVVLAKAERLLIFMQALHGLCRYWNQLATVDAQHLVRAALLESVEGHPTMSALLVAGMVPQLASPDPALILLILMGLRMVTPQSLSSLTCMVCCPCQSLGVKLQQTCLWLIWVECRWHVSAGWSGSGRYGSSQTALHSPAAAVC